MKTEVVDPSPIIPQQDIILLAEQDNIPASEMLRNPMFPRVRKFAGRIALVGIALATPFFSSYREFGTSEQQDENAALSAPEASRLDIQDEVTKSSKDTDVRIDVDNPLLPRIEVGEKIEKTHKLTLNIDEKWAEWFAADNDAGVVINAEDPKNAMDFVVASVKDPDGLEDRVVQLLRSHKDLFDAQPTEIVGVTITGHASAEDDTLGSAGLDTPSTLNSELADIRAQTVGPEFIKRLQRLGFDATDIEYGEPVEDRLDADQISKIADLTAKYGYSDAYSMIMEFNRAERGDAQVELPDEVTQTLHELLSNERYVEVVVKYKTTEGRELSISIPWFILPLVALGSRIPEVTPRPEPRPRPAPTEPHGPNGSGGGRLTPRPPRPFDPRPPKPPRSNRDPKQERQFAHNGVGHGTDKPKRIKQPLPHNYFERKGLPNGRRGKKSVGLNRQGR